MAFTSYIIIIPKIFSGIHIIYSETHNVFFTAMLRKVQSLRESVQNVLENDDWHTTSTETVNDITISWDEISNSSFLIPFWKESLVTSSKGGIFSFSEYKDLLMLFGLICELRKCHRFHQQLNVPSRVDFQLLVIRSFLQAEEFCWIDFLSTPASTSESLSEIVLSAIDLRDSTNRIIESFSNDTLKLFMEELVQYLIENSSFSYPFPAVLWHCLSRQCLEKIVLVTLHLSHKFCEGKGESIFCNIIGDLFYRMNASSSNFLELILEHAEKFVLPQPISRLIVNKLLLDDQAICLCESVLLLWSSKSFIASSAIAVYSSICDLLQFLVERLSLQKLDTTKYSVIDQLELSFIDGLSSAIELDMEKLDIALKMLTNVCSNSDTDAFAFTALSGLVASLSPLISQQTIMHTGSIVKEESLHLVKEQDQQALERQSRRGIVEILEELKDCTSRGPESKFHQKDVLFDLEDFIKSVPDVTEYSEFIGEILQALLSLRTLGDEEKQESVKNILSLLTKEFPEIVLRHYCILLHGGAGSQNDTKFSTFDVSLCFQILAMIEDAVFYIETLSHSFIKKQHRFEEQMVSNQPQQNSKTKVKAPKKLAKMKIADPANLRTSDSYYQVIVDIISTEVLDGIWFVLEKCLAEFFSKSTFATSSLPSISIQSSSHQRRYLIEELSISSSLPCVDLYESTDYGLAHLLAQTLHSLSAILLCLSRSASSLPHIKRITLHWNIKLSYLMIDTIFPRLHRSVFEIVSVRRSIFGGMLTAVERLSRYLMNDENEVINIEDTSGILQKIVALIDTAMSTEHDSICQKMLVQTSGLILMCQL